MSGEWRGTFRDRVLRSGHLILPPWVATAAAAGDPRLAQQVDEMLAALAEAEVFVADNVAEYLYAGTDQEHWGPHDFPCVAPPFPVVFVEWGRPSRVVSEVYGVIDAVDTAPAHTGWLIVSRERPDGEPGWLVSGTQLMEIDDRDPSTAVWGTGIVWSTIVGSWVVAGDGSIERMLDPYALYDVGLSPRQQESVRSVVTAFSSTAWPALLALTFANCRNVPRRTVEVPPPILRRDRKRGRPARRGYHLLEIGPIQRTLREEGGLGGEHGSLQRALHVCRGHFKTYTTEAPLFGRVTGTWWWAPHLRGDPAHGTSEKDYRVHADRGAG